MARQPRFVLPGHPQHVIQRGNNRSVLFGAEADYAFYLEKSESIGSDSIERSISIIMVEPTNVKLW